MNVPTPKYEQIKQSLKKQIHVGALAVGAPVPSERELTVTFGVTRNQTRQALRELELEGYLDRAQGRRSVVAAPEKRARPLIVGNKPTFAIALQDQQTLHTQKLLQGFMQAASAAGAQTIAYNLEFDSAGELQFLDHIRDSGLAGLAFWPHFDQERSRDILRDCVQSGFPVVLLDRYLRGLEVEAVVTDNIAVGRLLTEALIRRGHERIAFMAEEDRSTAAQERFEGFLEAHKNADLDFEQSLYAVVDRGYGDVDAAVRALQSRKHRPSAYFCVHDRLSQAVGRLLVSLGYAIPEDILLASLGDEQCAVREGPPMLTLEQPSRELGRQAFALLWARRQNNQASAPVRVHRLAPTPDQPIEACPQKKAARAAFA